jgi:hypothetical protein
MHVGVLATDRSPAEGRAANEPRLGCLDSDDEHIEMIFLECEIYIINYIICMIINVII